MKVVWSAWVLQQLDDIHAWYFTQAVPLGRQASPTLADRIVQSILAVTRLLEQFPYGGQVESWLDHLGLGHRREPAPVPEPG